MGLWAVAAPDPGSRGVDWEAVRRKAGREEWAGAVVRGIRDTVASTRREFPEPPFGVTGWAHDYYCEKDATKLRYDPAKPREHVCPKCGGKYADERRNEAWMDATYKRIHRAARLAGVLRRISDDDPAADYGRQVLLWFANNVDRFAPHGRHAGRGRIMGQSLCEATSMVDLALAYWDLYPALSAGERDDIVRRLFLPEAEFIDKQTGTIHNIHSWHNAAVGLIGLVSGEPRWVDSAVDGPFGLKAQIAKGAKEDGFWYEGSIGYHFYTLRSLCDFYIALRARGRDLSGTEKFRLMFSVPVDYACGDFILPAINDGWAGGRLAGNAGCYECAAALWPADAEIPRLLAWFYRGEPRNSVEALLFGPAVLPPPTPVSRGSTLLRDMGYAILRDGRQEVLVKFGPYGGGHEHLDRPNVILFSGGREVMPDLGTSGYGIRLNRWYRSPAAHNILVVDGKVQAPRGGVLVSFATNRVEVGAREAYPGVDIRRTVTCRDGVAGDRITAASDAEHTYDLFYHFRGDLTRCSATLAPAEIARDGSGYEWLRDVQRGSCSGRVECVIGLRDLTGHLVFEGTGAAPFEIFTGTCPDNPADRTMTFVLLRARGRNAGWTVDMKVRRSGEDP